jgi:hypothetical protein
VGPALFRARGRKAKIDRGSAKKKELPVKKAKASSAKEKQRKFGLFLTFTAANRKFIP